MKQLLRNDNEYKRARNMSDNAAIKHYGGVDVGELMPISVEEYLPDTTSLVHDFVMTCARFAFNNFSNRHYPGTWPWSMDAIPRPNHGAAHSMRQLMFGIIIQHKMLACNPGAFMNALTIDIGGGRKRLEEPDLLKRYLALSVAPLFNNMGRAHDHKVRVLPTEDGSYRWLFASLLGIDEGGTSLLLETLTTGPYAAESVYAHQVVSFTMYRIMMNHLLNVSGDDADFSRFVDYVATAGLYRLSVAKRNVFSPQSTMDRFVLLNELVAGAEDLDNCRDDTSNFYGTHSAKYYLYVASLGECGEDGARKHAQEMEAVVIHAISATLDFEGGDTTKVECAKEPPMLHKGARSVRNYRNSATRKVLLKNFDNIFYLLFNEFQSGKSARFDIRISTLLNPSLRHIRNRVFKFDVAAAAKKVVALGKHVRYEDAPKPVQSRHKKTAQTPADAREEKLQRQNKQETGTGRSPRRSQSGRPNSSSKVVQPQPQPQTQPQPQPQPQTQTQSRPQSQPQRLTRTRTRTNVRKGLDT